MKKQSVVDRFANVVTRRRAPWVSLIVGALVLAACGGTGTETTTTAAAAATTTTAAAAPETTMAAEESSTTMSSEMGPLEPLASGFPDSPITLWAAFQAGHPDDVLNRTIAEIASDYSPVRIVTDTNEIGPGLAYTFSKDFLPTLPRADEGYQIYTSNFAALAIRPYSVDAVKDSNIEDLHEIIGIQTTPFAYAVLKDSEFQTLDDVVQYAKDNPGQLRYVAGGTGSRGALQMLVWLDEAGIDATFVPTSNAAESSQVMQGGGAELFGSGIHSIDLDTFRVLAVTGQERLDVVPDSPTMKELGYTNVLQLTDAYTLSGYGTLADVPEENQQWLAELITRAVEDPRFAETYSYAVNGPISVDDVHKAEQDNIDVLFPILQQLGLNVRDR